MEMNQALKILWIVAFALTFAEQQDIEILRDALRPLLSYIYENEDSVTYSAAAETLDVFDFIDLPSTFKNPTSRIARSLDPCKGTTTTWGSQSYHKALNISYLHFTRSNPRDAYNFQPTRCSLNESKFDPGADSIFVIHGYDVVLGNRSLFFDIKDELLIEGRYNVFVVNWTNYNQAPYPKASVNAALVGFEISRFIKFLTRAAGISAERVYMIGHSLGAHVCGFAGKLTPYLARITACDAAGPIFQFLPPIARLTYTDAVFVDGIHTSGALSLKKGLGTLYAYADQDFFPNGGSMQPACENNREFQYTDKTTARADTPEKKVSCNHNLSVKYFLESINSRNCSFLSVLCSSYVDARRGTCKSAIVTPMGYRARPIPMLKEEAMFYLKTNAESPYCIPIRP